jgi:tight adherence protein C
MPLYIYLAGAAVIGSLALLVFALLGHLPTQLVRRNLATAGGRVTDLRETVLARPAQERVVRPTVATLARGARIFTPAGVYDTLERRVNLAGVARQWPLERVLAAKLMLGSLGLFFGLLIMLSSPSLGSLLLAAAFAATAFFAPDILLLRAAASRQLEIERELPDVLDQVTICVEAGLGFEAAMARAAATGRGPLADELAHTLQDVRLGVPRTSALNNLLARTDVADLRHFVVAIGQAERHGVPVSQVLRVQATELREKRRQRAEERAMKIPVKLVFPLIFCILPALFVVLVGPAFIRIADTGLGG